MADKWKYSEKNPDYARYINSPEWRKVANERLETDHHICCVCGGKATEVHHLTYEHFKNEQQDELVSLCHECHAKAEDIYDSTVTPWALDEIKPEGNNFMAAMRTDACMIAPMVFDYLMEVRGSDFDSLMRLRQPEKGNERVYWTVLKKAVNALCKKRYYMNCVEDRRDMMLKSINNHIIVICLAHIEHFLRNSIQSSLHEFVWDDYQAPPEDGRKKRTWKDVAAKRGLTKGTVETLKKDDGTSFGPSLRETVLYYCGLDAVAGIYPLNGFSCLSEDDYVLLNEIADHMTDVSGSGAFKGEYVKNERVA